MSTELLIPVIMCGGAGTRLWPVSRESMPKQFVPLIDERSTFQQVLGRIANANLFERPIVITNSDFRFIVAEQLRQCDIEADIVLEPSRRDSAMAVAVAAELAARREPQACVLVLAADHVVRNAEASKAPAGKRPKPLPTARSSRSASRRPIPRPITATSVPARSSTAAQRTPSKLSWKSQMPQNAGAYIAESYLWNSGNFLFRADVMLEEIAHFEPDIAAAAKSAVDGMKRDLDFLRLPPEPFARAPKKSIDYAVMERTDLAAVVPVDIGWSDVGSWNSVWEVLPHDRRGQRRHRPRGIPK